MNYDPLSYRYPSMRTMAVATRGMVCTSTPQAAQAGLRILQEGGNAFDAAVATAACLPVLEPVANGLGSDAFALIWSKGKLYGLNSSGVSPKAISLEKLKAKGLTKMPQYGWDSVDVPGAPAAWAAINKRFGRLPLSQVVEPAAWYAENGFAVSPIVAKAWKRGVANYTKLEGEVFKPWAHYFTNAAGKAPQAGEIFKNPDQAYTIRSIGKTQAESYYRGELMEKIVDFSNKTGGWLTEDDFANWYPEWVEPIGCNYKGYDVYEIPPNGHGITTLMALNILKGMELPEERECAETYHKMIEAMKLAFVDAQQYVSDPRTMTTKVEDMLSEAYAASRRALITDTALDPTPGKPFGSGTVYLCAADNEGNMISYIQSNFTGFGSGVVVPGTGISLQNRGLGFSFDPTSDNVVAGGKRPYHTIIPGFLCKDGQAVGPFGVMGGFMQPQGHMQVVTNAIDFHMNPQECLDAPRWQWTGGKHIQLEHGVGLKIARELKERGHEIEILTDNGGMGRGQIIWQLPGKGLIGGTEPRCDGQAAVW